MTDPHDELTPLDDEDLDDHGTEVVGDLYDPHAFDDYPEGDPEPEPTLDEGELPTRPERAARDLPVALEPDEPRPFPVSPNARTFTLDEQRTNLLRRLGREFDGLGAGMMEPPALQKILLTDQTDYTARNTLLNRPWAHAWKEILYALFVSRRNEIALGQYSVLVQRDQRLVRRRIEEAANEHVKNRPATLDEFVRVPDLLIVLLGWSPNKTDADVLADVLVSRDQDKKITWLIGDLDELRGDRETLNRIMTRVCFLYP
jgi:hypothetical protein